MLNASDTFRSDFLRLGELCRKRVQLVYLTATLLLSDIDRFYYVAGLKAETLTVFRDSTARPEISY